MRLSLQAKFVAPSPKYPREKPNNVPLEPARPDARMRPLHDSRSGRHLK
jgi:hypothetical protein